MASTFRNNVTAGIGTGRTQVYAVPGSTTSTIIGLSLSNVTGSGVEANVMLADNSGYQGVREAHIIKNGPVPVGGALVVVGGDQKLVMEATDNICVESSAAASLDVIVSILEQT